MNLESYREKLSGEICEVKRIITAADRLDHRIQVHVYCIAALLRRIMLRYPEAKSINIQTEEWPLAYHGHRGSPPGQATMSLSKLVDRILHYFEFVPARLKYPLGISVLSDYDSDLYSREFKLWDFIDAAQRVSEDDQWILPGVLTRTKARLNNSIHCEQTIRENRETMDMLSDLFNLVRRIGIPKLPEGSIDIFHIEVTLPMGGPPRIRVESMEYEHLFQNLLLKWSELPVGPPAFSPQTTLKDNEVCPKVVQFESSRPEFVEIRADDLFNCLTALESVS